MHDEPLTQDDFNEFVEDTVKEIQEEWFIPKNLQPIKDCNFCIVQNVQHLENAEKISIVQNVQHNKYSTTSAEPDEQIQINTNKDIEQINNNKEINNVNNKQLYIEVINSLFLRSGEGLFNKKEIDFFTGQILEEVKVIPKDPEAYFKSVVDMIVTRRKKKLGILPSVQTPFYNWLEA